MQNKIKGIKYIHNGEKNVQNKRRKREIRKRRIIQALAPELNQ